MSFFAQTKKNTSRTLKNQCRNKKQNKDPIMTILKDAASVDGVAGHSRTSAGILFKRSTLLLLLGLFLCSSSADADTSSQLLRRLAKPPVTTTTTTTSTTPSPVCGDGTCSGGSETCSSCPQDCGACSSPNCGADAGLGGYCKCLDGATHCRYVVLSSTFYVALLN